MDMPGIFELGTRAGRAYVRAIRQAYRDAREESNPAEVARQKLRQRLGDLAAGCDDRARQQLVDREAEQEVSEPRECECWVGHGDCGGCSGVIGISHEPACGWEWNPWCPVHPQTSATPADFDGFGPCECVCRLCIQGEHCDTASCATLPDPFDIPAAAPTVESRMECESVDAAAPVGGFIYCGTSHPEYGPRSMCTKLFRHDGDHEGIAGSSWVAWPRTSLAPPAPTLDPSTAADDSQTAAVEVTTADVIADVLADHIPRGSSIGIYCNDRAAGHEEPHAFCADWQEWRFHLAVNIATRIDGGVGVTPTPKPAEAEAASTFEQHQKRQEKK